MTHACISIPVLSAYLFETRVYLHVRMCVCVAHWLPTRLKFSTVHSLISSKLDDGWPESAKEHVPLVLL